MQKIKYNIFLCNSFNCLPFSNLNTIICKLHPHLYFFFEQGHKQAKKNANLRSPIKPQNRMRVQFNKFLACSYVNVPIFSSLVNLDAEKPHALLKWRAFVCQKK